MNYYFYLFAVVLSLSAVNVRSLHLETQDLCSPNPCGNNGTCAVVNDEFNCTCTIQYSGANCSEQVNVNEEDTMRTINKTKVKRKRCLKCDACTKGNTCLGYPTAVCNVKPKKCGCSEQWAVGGKTVKCGSSSLNSRYMNEIMVLPHHFCSFYFARQWKKCKPIKMAEWIAKMKERYNSPPL